MATNHYAQQPRQGSNFQPQYNARCDEGSCINEQRDEFGSRSYADSKGYDSVGNHTDCNDYDDHYSNVPQHAGYNGRYEHNEQRDHRNHERMNFQNRREPQYQHGNRGPPPERSYQYDDRYRPSGPNRQPQQVPYRPPPQPANYSSLLSQGGQYRDHTARHLEYHQPRSNFYQDGGRLRNDEGPRRMTDRTVVRDRILDQQPESPKVTSWDNPFPAFPAKRKQAEFKPIEPTESRTNAQSLDTVRPSTSHGSRNDGSFSTREIARPHTSQSRREFGSPKDLFEIPPMPMRGEHESYENQAPLATPNSNYVNDDLDRPVLRRAATGPAVSHTLDDHDFTERQYPANMNRAPYNEQFVPLENDRQGQPRQDPYFQTQPYMPRGTTEQRSMPRNPSAGSDHQRSQRQGQWNESSYQKPTRTPTELTDPSTWDSTLQARFQNPQVPDRSDFANSRRPSSDPAYQPKEHVANEEYDAGSYRGVTSTKRPPPDNHFWDKSSQVDEQKKQEDMLISSSAQPRDNLAYQKPTYQSLSRPQFEEHQMQSTDINDNLVSPLGQFSFDLNNGAQPDQAHGLHESTRSGSNQSSLQHDQNIDDAQPKFESRQTQHAQENTPHYNGHQSRNVPGYATNRPSQFRPRPAQPQPAPRNYDQDYQDYDHGNSNQYRHEQQFPVDEPYHHQKLPASQEYNHMRGTQSDFNHRALVRPGLFASQQPMSRPIIPSAGSQASFQGPPGRGSLDNFRSNEMPNSDSYQARPVPFRPGLMTSPPPTSRPTPPPQPIQLPVKSQAPTTTKPNPEAEPPITIRDLNILREDYKAHPNDHALGLRFAKRLVEAAKVLANDNGRADAKQTAKNRERYILDAHKTVKRLCSAGYSEAMFYLADCNGQGLLGLETDPKEAFSLYQSAAKLGHAQAAYRVAVCCELGAEEGGGTRRDPLKAVQWYKRAASLGDAPAMYKMGMILLKGLLGQSKSSREGISWLKRAAERADEENPHALHELGLLYEKAQPTDVILRDEKYALQLFQQAADLGYKYSQFRLGSAYEYGLLGLPVDPRMSIAWYSRAAKQGEHQSEIALSGWYLTGSGQPAPGEQPLLQQSDTEAYLWARKAASSGLAKAEYAMGYYTEVGIGVTPNIEEAKRWYYRAAAQNDVKARTRLEDLKKGGQRMQKTRVSRSDVGRQKEGDCTVM